MNFQTSFAAGDQIARLEALDATVLVGEQVWKTLSQIELFSETWVLHGVPRSHSFGRLPDEEEIRAWSIPRTSGYLLFMLLTLNKPKAVLEIGTSLAYSSIWIAAALARFGGELWTCEIFPPKIELAKKNIALSGLQNIKLLEGDAFETTRKWQKPIDLLFLDADPENYESYWNHLEPSMNHESIVIMDNAIDHFDVTRHFRDKMSSSSQWESTVFPIDHGLLVARKKSYM